jgi:putative ABC transport system permease protein
VTFQGEIMTKITLTMMRRNIKMFILAGIAIVIGTAFISSTFLFTNSLQKSLLESVAAPYRGATHEIAFDDSNPEAKAVDPTLADVFQLEKSNKISDWRMNDNLPVSALKGKNKTSGLIFPMATTPSLMPVHLMSGSWPHTGQIAVSPVIAKSLKAQVGSTISLVDVECSNFLSSEDGCVNPHLTVSGIVDDNDESESMGGALVLSLPDYIAFNEQTLQQSNLLESENETLRHEGAVYVRHHPYAPLTREQLMRSKASVTDVMVVMDQSHNPSSVMTELKAKGVRGYRIRTARAAEMDTIKSETGGMNIVQVFLLIFGFIALLVAGIVISNTFQVIVAQRRRNLALLRAIGAKRSQLYRSVVMESVLLGFISSAIGIALACVIAGGLQLGHARMGTTQFYFVPDVTCILVPLIFGIVVAVLASLSSAHLATSVTPLEALRPLTHVEGKKAGAVRGIISALLLLASLLCIFYVKTDMGTAIKAAQNSGSSNEGIFMQLLCIAILGCAFLFIAIVISAVWWIPWTLKGIGALVEHCGPSSRIAAANVVRNPRRVAATGVALVIGVTLVTTISTGASTFKATSGALVDSHYTVDLVLDDAIDHSRRYGSSAEQVLSKIRTIHGVQHAQTVDQITFPTEATVTIPGAKGSKSHQKSLTVYSISSTARRQVMRAHNLVPSDSRHTAVVTASGKKELSHWKDGDTFALRFVNGRTVRSQNLRINKRRFVIPDIAQMDTDDSTLTALIDPSVLTDMPSGLIHRDTQVWVRIKDGADGLAVINSIRNEFGSSAQIYGPWVERKTTNDAINQVMLVMIGLLAVSIIIALIGVANTLSLSVIERARENATLRAIGMTRSQLRRLLLIEALLISVSASIAGVILGSFFGWFGSWVVITPTTGNMVFSIDWGITGTIIVVSILAALISSIAPARRALKMSPVEVLSEP